ncbi:MAG: hypothetical protein ABL890_00590 [Candidatus Peribacteraceae bacterium]
MARKPRRGTLSDAQEEFIVDLGVSKAECARIIGHAVEKISQLSRAQAYLVIRTRIEDIVRKFPPGSKVELDVRITQGTNEGPPAFLRTGNTTLEDYEITTADAGLYLNAVIKVHELHRTIKRTLVDLLQAKPVLVSSPTDADEQANKTLADYNNLQELFQKFGPRFYKTWEEMLHSCQLPIKATDTTLTPQLKRVLVSSILSYFQQRPFDPELITDDEIRDAIRQVAGVVLWG